LVTPRDDLLKAEAKPERADKRSPQGRSVLKAEAEGWSVFN
jgi:hypothetical protein